MAGALIGMGSSDQRSVAADAGRELARLVGAPGGAVRRLGADEVGQLAGVRQGGGTGRFKDLRRIRLRGAGAESCDCGEQQDGAGLNWAGDGRLRGGSQRLPAAMIAQLPGWLHGRRVPKTTGAESGRGPVRGEGSVCPSRCRCSCAPGCPSPAGCRRGRPR